MVAIILTPLLNTSCKNTYLCIMQISKKTSLLILGITSIVFSRAMFLFINDPEGPNLVVVLGMATIVFLLSWAIFKGLKKLPAVIVIQIAIVTGFYFGMS
jgi:hypothetical protein